MSLNVELSALEDGHGQKRDHRVLGRELGLFMMSPEVGAGLPLWLPRGAMLRDTLERFLRQEQLERGYVPVMTPHIGLLDLYKTSGHWYKYRDRIYPPMVDAGSEASAQDEWLSSHDSCSAPAPAFNAASEEDEQEGRAYILRPMNCPHHIQIYKSELRSYRDLPLRLAEFGTVYRLEQAGELNGLLRSRAFTVDDSHLFVMPEQLDEEFIQVVDLVRFVFKALGLDEYRARVGLRDPASSKYVGSDRVWAMAQAAILNALDKLGFPYTIEEGEAGFYGPKLDFVFRDVLGREWQLGTVQVDYNLPERFDLSYVGEDGQRHRPVMIHRAPGSIERLIAILLEQCAGAFPVWLAPVQAMIIPIADRHYEYASKVQKVLKAAGVRAEVDKHSERMNAKIRNAQVQKIPYMLVVGDKEMAEEAVAVRLRSEEHVRVMPLADFVERIREVVKERSGEL